MHLTPEQEWILVACGLIAHADGEIKPGERDLILAMLAAAGSIATTVTAALASPSASQRRRRHAPGWRSLRRGSRSVSSRTISCGRPDPAGSR